MCAKDEQCGNYNGNILDKYLSTLKITVEGEQPAIQVIPTLRNDIIVYTVKYLGPTIIEGTDGIDGLPGAPGKSAYQIWLDAGNAGSILDFLNSLKGANGTDAVQYPPPTDGINGLPGVDGKTPVITIGTVVGGETASATITGDPATPKLNLVIPSGGKGKDGLNGKNGAGTSKVVLTSGTERIQKGVRYFDFGSGSAPEVTNIFGTGLWTNVANLRLKNEDIADRWYRVYTEIALSSDDKLFGQDDIRFRMTLNGEEHKGTSFQGLRRYDGAFGTMFSLETYVFLTVGQIADFTSDVTVFGGTSARKTSSALIAYAI